MQTAWYWQTEALNLAGWSCFGGERCVLSRPPPHLLFYLGAADACQWLSRTECGWRRYSAKECNLRWMCLTVCQDCQWEEGKKAVVRCEDVMYRLVLIDAILTARGRAVNLPVAKVNENIWMDLFLTVSVSPLTGSNATEWQLPRRDRWRVPRQGGREAVWRWLGSLCYYCGIHGCVSEVGRSQHCCCGSPMPAEFIS